MRRNRLGRVDSWVFAAETGVMATFLLAMVAMVFLDVVHRTLDAPSSRLGLLIAKLGGITDPARRAWIDTNLAPYVGTAVGLLLLWIAFANAERARSRRFLGMRGSAMVLALATALGLAGLGWAMLNVASIWIIGGLFALGAALWVMHEHRSGDAPRRTRAWISAVAGGVAFYGVALRFVPEGYSWSQKVALPMLLWVGFLGASVCVYTGKHLRLEAFDRLIPESAKRWVHGAGFLIAAAFCGFMAVLGFEYVFGTMGMYELGGLLPQTEIPDWTMILAAPVAFAITTIRLTAAALSTMTGGSYGRPAPNDAARDAQQLSAQAAGESR